MECDQIIDFIMKATSVASLETAKVVVHLNNFLIALTVILSMPTSIVFCYVYSSHESKSRKIGADKAKQSHKKEV